nr:uncharacterized protein LOC133619168 isoform X3 [Nerophis lumbriciformis]
MCERTIAECEEEPLDAVYKKRHIALHGTDVQQTPHVEEDPHPPYAEGEDEDSQTPQFKEEEEELWITQEGECVVGQEEDDLTKFPLTVVSVKIEEYEEKPPESSQLHQSPRASTAPPH